jgi:hypothetical protein
MRRVWMEPGSLEVKCGSSVQKVLGLRPAISNADFYICFPSPLRFRSHVKLLWWPSSSSFFTINIPSLGQDGNPAHRVFLSKMWVTAFTLTRRAETRMVKDHTWRHNSTRTSWCSQHHFIYSTMVQSCDKWNSLDSPIVSVAAWVGGTVLVSSAVPPVRLCVLLPSPPPFHMTPLPPPFPPAPLAELAAVAHPEFCDVYQIWNIHTNCKMWVVLYWNTGLVHWCMPSTCMPPPPVIF